MRLFPAVVLLFLFSSFALAQSNVFPAVLEPSVPQGAEKNKIFKLLPRDKRLIAGSNKPSWAVEPSVRTIVSRVMRQ